MDIVALSQKYGRSPENIIEAISWVNPLFFPANKFWYWLPVRRDNITILPRQKVELWNEKGNGWIYYALFWADNPKLTLQLDVYADTLLDMTIDFETLETIGSLNLGQGFFTITKYDTANDIYVAQYAPIGYGVPFRGRNICIIHNPTASPITLKKMYAWLIMLKEEE